MAAHARLSPSNTRWPHCPGSPRAEAPYPDIPGDAAIDGTGSHLLLELCINEDKAPEDYIGVLIGANHEDRPQGWVVDAERASRVRMAINYLERRRQELFAQYPGGLIHIVSESKADPGGMFGRTDWHGTCDITIRVFMEEVFKGPCVYVETIDYKDGRGWVAVEDNTQLLSYLGGKARPAISSGPDMVRPLHTGKLDSLRMTVVQPKTNPPVRYQDLAPAQLLEKLEDLSWRAHKTDDPDAPLIPGPHCTWCKHKPNCSEQSKKDIEVLKEMTIPVLSDNRSLFELVETAFSGVEVLSNDQLASIADTKDGVLAGYERIDAELRRRLDQGETVPGYALRPGRGSRVWAKDEADVAKALKSRKFTKDEIYPPKLISPAQALKSDKLSEEQRKRLEDEYIAFVAGDVRVAKVGREKTQNDPAALFADIPDFTAPAAEKQPEAAAPSPDDFNFL